MIAIGLAPVNVGQVHLDHGNRQRLNGIQDGDGGMAIARRIDDDGRAAGAGFLEMIHDLAFASRFMDRLVLMDRGAVVAEGSPAQVLTPDRLASVYRVDALRGAQKDEDWVLPWSRLSVAKIEG